MTKLKIMGAAAAVAIVAGCCDENQCTEKTSCSLEPVITVNGESLTKCELDTDLNKILELQKDKIPSNQLEMAKKMYSSQMVQTFMINKVLGAKAKELGITITDEEIKKAENEFVERVKDIPGAPKTLKEALEQSPFGAERAMEEFRNGIIFDKMLKAEVYDKDTKDYSEEAQKIIAQIVKANSEVLTDEAALKKIQSIKSDLDKVADSEKKAKFAELAKEFSGCPSGKAKGGDLDFFTRGMMGPEFDEVAFKSEIGKISDPVKTSFGYHLIMVTEKKAAVEAKGDAPAEPESVRASHILIKTGTVREVPSVDEVVNQLKNMGNRMKVQEYITDLIRNAKIETIDEYKSLIPEEPVTPPATEEKAEVAIETPAK